MRIVIAALIATAVAGAPAYAAPCKDAKTGKFVKCPDKAPAEGTRCKTANGKFAKCGTPGAKPM